MEELVQELAAYFTTRRLLIWASALALFIVGTLVSRALSVLVGKIAARRAGPRHAEVLQRTSFYGFLVLTVGVVLSHLGFDLKVLLGAAGVLTVAIGFASQTSASNIISGLFLLGERPFVVGDTLQIADTIGEVVSIDLLSVRIRTFDNLAVRVPNETLLKTTFTNLTHFPIRRLDILIGVAYDSDIEEVRRVLLGVADRNALCLDEPRPLFLFKGFGDSALSVQFSVWAVKENYLEMRNTIYVEIKRALDAHGIVIPFPQRTVHIVESGEKIRTASKQDNAEFV